LIQTTFVSKVTAQLSRPFGLGGSDIAAALGLSPFRTPVQLWAEKLGKPGVVPAEGLALRVGQHLESFIAREYETHTGRVCALPTGIFQAPDEPHFYGHVDRLVLSEGEQTSQAGAPFTPSVILECKSAGSFTQHLWGERGSDQIPVSYLVQCVWYLWLTKATRADVAVLIGNHDFRIYHVARDEGLEAMVLKRVRRFWHEHVLADMPPSVLCMADVPLLYPSDDGTTREADAAMLEVLRQLSDAQARAKLIDDEIDALRLQLVDYMGDCSHLAYQGKVLATYRQSKPVSRFDQKAFDAAHPDLAKRFRSESPGIRRFVVKAPTRSLAQGGASTAVSEVPQKAQGAAA